MSAGVGAAHARPLAPSASAETIKSAYRKAARLYHPDRNPDPGAADRFRSIQAAYDLLADDAHAAVDPHAFPEVWHYGAHDLPITYEFDPTSEADGATITIDGDKGKPLSEIDLTGTPPHRLVVLGPDAVEITQGDKLAITVSGEQAEDVRFTLKDGTLGILRKDGNWGRDKAVNVNVTLPALSEIAAMGARIREHRASVILALDTLDIEAQMSCAAIFLNALFDAPREHWFPALVVVDEAQMFAPSASGDVSDTVRRASLAAMTNLMCRGRKRGLAGIVATQRLAKLAKNVAAEASNFLMGRTFLDIDMARAADLLFEVITRRYQRASTIVSTNKAFSEWHEIFPNATSVVTLIDRLTHQAEVLSIEGQSYRLKESRERAEKKQQSRRTQRKKSSSA